MDPTLKAILNELVAASMELERLRAENTTLKDTIRGSAIQSD